MINKWINFFVLWGMLVMVQGFAITIMDFSSNLVTMIVTATGTALTLYLGLRVERQRVMREVRLNEDDRRSDDIKRISEEMFAKKPFKIHEMITPSDLEASGVSTRNDLPLFMYPGLLVEHKPERPQPSAHFVIDGDKVYTPEDLLAGKWEAVKEEVANEIIFQPEFCKHCYRQIDGRVHAEGMARGRMRCDPEDSQLVYGYNAEPTDEDCGPTCMGHK